MFLDYLPTFTLLLPHRQDADDEANGDVEDADIARNSYISATASRLRVRAKAWQCVP